MLRENLLSLRNLIGLLSWDNEHYPLGIVYVVKMAAENSHFAIVEDDEILQIQINAIPENTKKATKYGLRMFQGNLGEFTF